MILRLFMMTIKPSDSLLKRKKPDGFDKFRIRLYQGILKRLMKSYSYYAVNDKVDIPGMGVTVRHEFRDLAFETEVKRNKLEFLPKVKRKKSHFRYFSFVDNLYMTVDGKEICIRHDDAMSVSGNLRNKTRCSSGTGGIPQSVIEVLRAQARTMKEEQVTIPEKTVKSEKPVRRNRTGLFAKEKEIPVKEIPVEQPPVEEPQPEEPPTIGKKGFAIDTTF